METNASSPPLSSSVAAGAAVCCSLLRRRAEEDLRLAVVASPRKLARTEAHPFGIMSSFSIDPTDYCLRNAYHYAGSETSAAALQPFPNPASRIPGARFGSHLKHPFTWTQRQELERQALIYKHMVASVPIPADLLIPLSSRSFTDISSAYGKFSSSNVRFSSGDDPEPGRCRRTDGKKWRCSRDAAPDQKYCERHMNRGCPRSRKPVEATTLQDCKNHSSKTLSAAFSKAIRRTNGGDFPKQKSKSTLPAMEAGSESNEEQTRYFASMTSAAKDSNGSRNGIDKQPRPENLNARVTDHENEISNCEKNRNMEDDGWCEILAQSSWIGGPLGEILGLQPSSNSSIEDESKSLVRNSPKLVDSSSSPCCVLQQRTVASHSDSSGSSSTTFAATLSPSQQWLI